MNIQELIYNKLPKVTIGGIEWGVSEMSPTVLINAKEAAISHFLSIEESRPEFVDTDAKIEEFRAQMDDKDRAEWFIEHFALRTCETVGQFRAATAAIGSYMQFVNACCLISSETFKPLQGTENIYSLVQLISLENASEAIMQARESTKNDQAPPSSQE